MAVQRERPYRRFNFLVDLGNGADAGFQEVGSISAEVEVVEYRTGNARENNVVKLAGLSKACNVTLRRGVIGSLDLYEWFNQVRNGDPAALRSVTIKLMSEDHTNVVQSWKLLRAQVVKFTTGPFHAQSSDVAVEEIVLAYERLELE